MTERSWREHLPDLRRMALWTIERGERARVKGGEQGRLYRMEVGGSAVELFINASVSVEGDRCQLKIRSTTGNWKGALGLQMPAHLVIPHEQIVDFETGEIVGHEGVAHRPFMYETMERLDKKRASKKTSPGANQHDVSYFVYWFLIYGEMVGTAMFSNPSGSIPIFDEKTHDIFRAKGVPYTYLNDPTGKFPTDFIMAKLA